MTELSDLIAEFEHHNSVLRQRMQDSFKDVIKNVFDRCPDLQRIVWSQYSPYFNDGEECVFSVYPPTFTNYKNSDEDLHLIWGSLDGDDLDDGVWAYGKNCYHDLEKNTPEEYKDIFNEVSEAMQRDAMEDVMRAMFGNHVYVVATREGFTVEDYSHD